MRPLALDFRRRPRRMRLAGCALAIAAAALALNAGWQYRELRADIALKEATLKHGSMLTVERPATLEMPHPEEYAHARDTVRRIAAPWDSFLDALEEAQTDRVTLLSIEPDIENRTVSLNGEAKDYLAALTYLAHLNGQERLARVHFVRHEVKRGGSRQPLAFTISAAWKEAR